MEWAKGEPRELSVSWQSYRPMQSPVDVRRLTLEELCCPMFEVDPPPPKRISDDQLHDAWDKYSKLPRNPDPRNVEALLDQTKELLTVFPTFDLTYVARAGTLARLSLFVDAEDVLADGFRNCSVRSALCASMGYVYALQGEHRAFGWHMQACHLGYEEYIPYLVLSEAAGAVGLKELRTRLLNAVDCISSSMPRLGASHSANSVASVALKNKELLIRAFSIFTKYADVYLPPVDAFPPVEDEHQRSIEAILVRGNPDGSRPSLRVCSRAFAQRRATGQPGS